MSHAKSLRVIGATLEAAQVTSFKLEKHAAPYRLWIAKRLFCFGPADISRLDARAQKTILPGVQHRCLSSCVRRPYTEFTSMTAVSRFSGIPSSDFRVLVLPSGFPKSLANLVSCYGMFAALKPWVA
jgi:hypothetical protein